MIDRAVVAGVMVWMGEEYIDYCLQGLHGSVDHVVVIEGAVGTTIKRGFGPRSTDKTLEILEKWDKHPDVTVMYKNMPSIASQWQLILDFVRDNFGDVWLLSVDDDEIYDDDILAEFFEWLAERPKLVGGKVPFHNFMNNFHTVFYGPGGPFVRTGKKIGFESTHPRVFGNGKLDTKHMMPPVIDRCPMKAFHYTWVRNAEHYERWKKWCIHRRAVQTYVVDGAVVEHPTIKLHEYHGSHPNHMHKHPYYNNPPAGAWKC